MEIVIGNQITTRQINIAEVQPSEVLSHESIQVRDLGIQYSENQLPTYTDIVETVGSSTNILQFTNVSERVEVTRRYQFDRQTGKVIPLWYRHNSRLLHYNTSGAFVQIEKRGTSTTAGDTWNLVPPTENVIICYNTLVVKANGSPISSSSYRLDLGRKRIIFLTNITGSVVATFYTVKPSITIIDSNSKVITKTQYRIDISKYEVNYNPSDIFAPDPDGGSINHLYHLEILMNGYPLNGETIWLKYASFKNYAVIETKDIVSYNPISTKVNNLSDLSSLDDYYVEPASFDISMISSKYDTIFVRPVLDRNGKIALIEPIGVPKNKPWYMQLSNDQLVRNTYTYELLKTGINNTSGVVKRRKEKIDMPISSVIEVKYTPLYITYDNQGVVTNINITKDEINYNSYIEYVDQYNGRIFLSQGAPIVPREFTIEYDSIIKYDEYEYLNVNPDYKFNATNEHINDKIVVFYMLPTEEVDIGRQRSVFHFMVYKDRLSQVNKNQQSVSEAVSYLTGVDDSGKSNLYNEINEYIDPGAGNVLHPIILGYISVTSPYSAKSLEFLDIRQRGGGIRDIDDYHEYLYEGLRHYLDIGYIDGFLYNLENIAIVDIPIEVLEEIESKLINYDPYTIRALRDNPDFDTKAQADDFIKRIVRRALRAGCHFTIKYVETT